MEIRPANDRSPEYNILWGVPEAASQTPEPDATTAKGVPHRSLWDAAGHNANAVDEANNGTDSSAIENTPTEENLTPSQSDSPEERVQRRVVLPPSTEKAPSAAADRRLSSQPPGTNQNNPAPHASAPDPSDVARKGLFSR